MWPESPAVLEGMMVEDHSSLTTIKPSVMKEQGRLVTIAHQSMTLTLLKLFI